MSSALLLALALQGRPEPPPALPSGVAKEFAKVVLSVEAKLVEGDVAGAREEAKALPVRAPRILWADDAALSPELRAEREKGFALIASRWAFVAKDFAPKTVTEKPDVTIAFASSLPDASDGLPAGSRVEYGPPYRATINATRGKPARPLRTDQLNAEFAYALGRYLGVPESPFATSAMRRDGRPDILTFMPAREETLLAARNLLLADRLRAAVAVGKPLGLTFPAMRLATPSFDLGTTPQGTPLTATLELENLGAGALEYRVTPDCSCFTPVSPGKVPPQGRAKIRLTMNTVEFVGRQDKRVLLETNDPERPVVEVPITFRSRPAYRLFRPGGDRVTAPEKGAATFDYFLFTPPGSDIHPTAVHWDGMPAHVTWEPWSGPLADPEMQEAALPRRGWRFHVNVPATLGAGRTNGTLTIDTDSPTFHTLLATLYVQKGIVADPVNLGDVTPGTSASLIVDRPNAPFKILGVDAGPLKATWTDRTGGWEYRIDLAYAGGAQEGDLQVKVRIRTDDPKQPYVETIARGFVR